MLALSGEPPTPYPVVSLLRDPDTRGALIGAGTRLAIHISAWRRAGGLKATMSKNALLSMALRQAHNRFLLVNLLTERIRELKDGARPLIQGASNLSIDEIALHEIAEGEIAPISTLDT